MERQIDRVVDQQKYGFIVADDFVPQGAQEQPLELLALHVKVFAGDHQ